MKNEKYFFTSIMNVSLHSSNNFDDFKLNMPASSFYKFSIFHFSLFTGF